MLRFSDLKPLAYSAKKLKSLCDLLLGEQIDLQIEMIPGVAALLHPVLLHENEGAKQHAFDGDDHGEQDKWVRIEMGKERKHLAVDEKPGCEDYYVNHDKPGTSAEAADHIRDEVFGRTALLEALFEVGNSADVGFYCRRCDRFVR